MGEIFKPLLSGTTPSPPKFNVSVTWSELAPLDENNQTPHITFGNTRAETLRFGGAWVQHSACCRVWICCPSTVVVVDIYQLILVWVLRLVHSLCVYSFSWWCHKQVPRCRSHGLYHPSTTKPSTNFPCLLGKIHKPCQPTIKTQILVSFSKVTVKQKQHH